MTRKQKSPGGKAGVLECHAWQLIEPVEAVSPGAFASRAERCHYLAAAWDQLSQDDRQRFLRTAI